MIETQQAILADLSTVMKFAEIAALGDEDNRGIDILRAICDFQFPTEGSDD